MGAPWHEYKGVSPAATLSYLQHPLCKQQPTMARTKCSINQMVKICREAVAKSKIYTDPPTPGTPEPAWHVLTGDPHVKKTLPKKNEQKLQVSAIRTHTDARALSPVSSVWAGIKHHRQSIVEFHVYAAFCQMHLMDRQFISKPWAINPPNLRSQ